MDDKYTNMTLMPSIEDYINAIKSPQDNLNKLKRFRPFLKYDGSMDFWFNEECIVFRMVDSLQEYYEFGLECCLTNDYLEKQRQIISSKSSKDIRIYEEELNVHSLSREKYLFPVILHKDYHKVEYPNNNLRLKEEETFAISEDGKTLLYWKMPSGMIGKSFMGAFIPEGIEIIAEGAFAGCNNLEVLYLPKSLKRIGRGAFMSCGGFELYLKSDHIEEIDEYAFWDCKLKMKSGIENLSNITGKISENAFTNALIYISFNNEYKVQRVKNGNKWSLDFTKYNFQEEYNNKNPFPDEDKILVDSVEDEYGVVYDKDYQYVLRCKNKDLTKYKVKKSAIGIFSGAFGGLINLVEINLSQVKYIGECAFAGSGIKNLKLPKSVSHLGYRAFGYCENLYSVEISSSIDTINPETFRDCPLLNFVSISESVVSIERMAFANCISLNSLHLSKCLIKIGELAFCNCAIKELELPKSLLHMDYSPFSGCRNTRIKSKSPLFYANEQFLLGYHNTRLISYLADEINIVVPGTVKSILGYSLTNKNKNARIYLPDSVNIIGHWAFRYAKAKQVNFPKSLCFVKISFDYFSNIESYIVNESALDLLKDLKTNPHIIKYNDENLIINDEKEPNQ